MRPVLGAATVLYCAAAHWLPAAQLLLQLSWENLLNLEGPKFTNAARPLLPGPDVPHNCNMTESGQSCCCMLPANQSVTKIESSLQCLSS